MRSIGVLGLGEARSEIANFVQKDNKQTIFIIAFTRRLFSSIKVNRELKQTDAAAAANLQISIEKDSMPSEFSRPLTSITLNLNGICLLTTSASVCLSSLTSKKLLWISMP